MITFYGAVADNMVWGIGLSQDGACFDAGVHLAELHTLSQREGGTKLVPPSGEISVVELSFEDCKRVANGDMRWKLPASLPELSPEQVAASLTRSRCH
jgi:hypothetical protein